MAKALKNAVASVGGALDVFYWALGEDDAVLIIDFPDLESAVVAGIAAAASSHARTKTTRLVTPDEVDSALGTIAKYRGQKKNKF
jgi:uncharacterized protein with GYD domain